MSDPAPEVVLRDVAKHLRRLERPFALVGGLAVSLRSEVRFTRDVDLAIVASDDRDTQQLVLDLQGVGYVPIALVEHAERGRLATVRLASPSGIVVDLLAASSGIEKEIVEAATPVKFDDDLGEVLVARAEELLAMKLLSVTEHRLQDRIDALNLILMNEDLDLDVVREHLHRITSRGYQRGQDLFAKLADVIASAAAERQPSRGSP